MQNQQAEEDAQTLVKDCRKHWESVRPRVRERLAISLRDFDEESDGFAATRRRFIRRMGRAARQAVVNLKIRGVLDMRLTERRASLKIWIYVCLMLLLSAGVAGSLKIGMYPYSALGFLVASALAMSIFVIQTHRSRKRLIESFEVQLKESQSRFADALGRDYRDGVRDFYIEYANMLESVRQYIVNAKLELQPNLAQWNDLFLELKEIEREL